MPRPPGLEPSRLKFHHNAFWDEVSSPHGSVALYTTRGLLPHMRAATAFVHPTAVVEDNVTLEAGVRIWHFCHVRQGAVIREGVSLGKGVFVDAGVTIGEHSRIQNGVSVYSGVTIAPWVFIGPHVVLTNDRLPRAGNRNWIVSATLLGVGASLGAGAVIRCGVTVGDFALVGAGTIVTRVVPPFHLAVGHPARCTEMVCACAQTRLHLGSSSHELLRECCLDNLDPSLLRLARLTLERHRVPQTEQHPYV